MESNKKYKITPLDKSELFLFFCLIFIVFSLLVGHQYLVNDPPATSNAIFYYRILVNDVN